MKIKPLIQSLIACGVLSTAFVASADVTVMNRDGSKVLFSDEFMKSPIPMGDKKITSIVEIDSEIITTIDDDRKEYYQTTIDEICEAQVKFENAANSIKEQMMSQFTKDQLEQMKQLQKNDLELITIKKGDVGIKIAGYSTTQYKVYDDDELIETLWLSTDKKLKKEFERRKPILDKINCMSNVLSEDLDYEDTVIYKALIEKGVVLKSYSDDLDEEDIQDYYADLASGDYDEDDEINISEVVKVDFSNIEAKEFTIPNNYKKVTQEEFYTTLNQETIDEFNQGIDAFNENSDEFNKAVEEAYDEYQVTNSTEETVINEPAAAAEEVSNKQKALDKIKKLAEKEGGAVGKLLGKLF